MSSSTTNNPSSNLSDANDLFHGLSHLLKYVGNGLHQKKTIDPNLLQSLSTLTSIVHKTINSSIDLPVPDSIPAELAVDSGEIMTDHLGGPALGESSFRNEVLLNNRHGIQMNVHNDFPESTALTTGSHTNDLSSSASFISTLSSKSSKFKLIFVCDELSITMDDGQWMMDDG